MTLVLGGHEGALLKLLGFHISISKPDWIMEPYEWLVSIQHPDDPESTVILPMDPEDDEAFDFLVSHLIDTQPHKLHALRHVVNFVGGCHEEAVVGFSPFQAVMEDHETELQRIRREKEAAIIACDFDRAADLRDRERKIQREYDNR